MRQLIQSGSQPGGLPLPTAGKFELWEASIGAGSGAANIDAVGVPTIGNTNTASGQIVANPNAPSATDDASVSLNVGTTGADITSLYSGGVSAGRGGQFWSGRNVTMTAKFRFDVAPTQLRFRIGLAGVLVNPNGGIANTDTPAVDFISLLNSPAAAATNWFAQCGTGGLVTNTDMGVLADQTIQKLSISYIPGQLINFNLNGLVVTLTTNLPSTSVQLYPFISLASKAVAVRTCRFYNLYVVTPPL